MFLDDISQPEMKNVLFADENIFYAESVNFHELVKTIHGFVLILSDWINTNKLVAHESKTRLTLFISWIHPVPPHIHFNQNSHEWVSHIKYFLIILNNKLSHKFYITDVCCRLSKIRVIYSVSRFQNRESLLSF